MQVHCARKNLGTRLHLISELVPQCTYHEHPCSPKRVENGRLYVPLVSSRPVNSRFCTVHGHCQSHDLKSCHQWDHMIYNDVINGITWSTMMSSWDHMIYNDTINGITWSTMMSSMGSHDLQWYHQWDHMIYMMSSIGPHDLQWCFGQHFKYSLCTAWWRIAKTMAVNRLSLRV